MKPYRVGIIGFGGMGQYWTSELAFSPRWNVEAICDVRPEARELAGKKYSSARIVADAGDLFREG